jgi:hypothetical protein
MNEIIQVYEFCFKQIWDLMVANWILCTIPVAFIVYILVGLIKGSTSK